VGVCPRLTMLISGSQSVLSNATVKLLLLLFHFNARYLQLYTWNKLRSINNNNNNRSNTSSSNSSSKNFSSAETNLLDLTWTTYTVYVILAVNNLKPRKYHTKILFTFQGKREAHSAVISSPIFAVLFLRLFSLLLFIFTFMPRLPLYKYLFKLVRRTIL
jgi:hypothetical protein